jgi:hypothetical protein
MTQEELKLIENQIYTALLLEEFKRQRKDGAIHNADFLIDKYTIDKKTAEELRKYLSEHK